MLVLLNRPERTTLASRLYSLTHSSLFLSSFHVVGWLFTFRFVVLFCFVLIFWRFFLSKKCIFPISHRCPFVSCPQIYGLKASIAMLIKSLSEENPPPITDENAEPTAQPLSEVGLRDEGRATPQSIFTCSFLHSGLPMFFFCFLYYCTLLCYCI